MANWPIKKKKLNQITTYIVSSYLHYIVRSRPHNNTENPTVVERLKSSGLTASVFQVTLFL